MRLQIDIDNKIIRVLDNPKLGDLLIELEELFPEGQWAEYTLEYNIQVIQSPPYTIGVPYIQPTLPMPINPYYPDYDKWRITCNSSTVTNTPVELSPKTY